MKIEEIDIRALEIPFRHTFSHSSATRSRTEAAIVKIRSADGSTGYGEGCPRAYVTQETMATALEFIADCKPSIVDIQSLVDLKQWIAGSDALIDQNPAAWCAIELALLDLLGKDSKQSVESLLGLPALTGSFQYTAILGAQSHKAFCKQLRQYHSLGLTDFKVKVSGNFDADRRKIDEIRCLGSDVRIRLDANNLWDDAEAAIAYIASLEYTFFAIEEPLVANDFEGMRRIIRSLSMPIILDESFLTVEQFKYIADQPENWIINLRVSKMGGLIRSLRIAEKARLNGVRLIIGAQVGESSILTRAALVIANAYREIVLAQEGAFGTYLLEHDVVDEPIMFGKNGQIDARSVSFQAGLLSQNIIL